MSSLQGDGDIFYVQIQGSMENGGCYITWSFMVYIYSSHKRTRIAKCCGPGSSVGIATELRGWKVRDRMPVGTRFSARPDHPWGPPSLLYNGYRVFPGG